MSIRLHPRHDATTRAHIDVAQAVCSAAEKYELTYAELVSLLAQILASWTKYQIRDERSEEDGRKDGD